MKINAIPFYELMEHVLDQLQAQGYMASTLAIYSRFYKRVHVFLNRSDTDFYTHEAGDCFLHSQKVSPKTYQSYACAIRRLDDYLDGKPYRCHHAVYHEQVPDEFSAVMDNYIIECKGRGNKPATIQFKERTCIAFLNQLKVSGCPQLSEITTRDITRAVLIFSNKDHYASVRQFLRYLAEKNITEKDYSAIIPHYRRRKSLPATYTPEEIIKIEDTIDTDTDVGKRDIAIIRLATRMGLRSGDIASLKLEEVDWEGGFLNIVQEKTGVPISLKMPDDVYSALATHAHNDKRSSIDGYVFHSMSAPYRHITTSIIRHVVNACFKAASVNTAGKRHGPHAFRSSLASSMVNDGVSYEVVRKILGHSDPDVIKHYAKADIENLRLCSIDPPDPSGRFKDFLSGREAIRRV